MCVLDVSEYFSTHMFMCTCTCFEVILSNYTRTEDLDKNSSSKIDRLVVDVVILGSSEFVSFCLVVHRSNQIYLYTAYFYKIQGCLQYKTIYVKILFG